MNPFLSLIVLAESEVVAVAAAAAAVNGIKLMAQSEVGEKTKNKREEDTK